jgi:hypothetical protein
MAGMEALGRVCNIIPIASSKPFKMRGASSVMVCVTGATAVATLNERSSFGGSDTALAVIKDVYWSTATDGTAAWNKLILSPLVSTYTHGTTTGLTTAVMSVFHVFTSQLSDPFNYLNVVATGSGLCSVTLVDLVHQRAPANLEILGS